MNESESRWRNVVLGVVYSKMIKPPFGLWYIRIRGQTTDKSGTGARAEFENARFMPVFVRISRFMI